jgi:hypothetical protein
MIKQTPTWESCDRSEILRLGRSGKGHWPTGSGEGFPGLEGLSWGLVVQEGPPGVGHPREKSRAMGQGDCVWHIHRTGNLQTGPADIQTTRNGTGQKVGQESSGGFSQTGSRD